MTAREMIQLILLNTRDLDATVYITKPIDDLEMKDYRITKIESWNSDDLFIKIADD